MNIVRKTKQYYIYAIIPPPKQTTNKPQTVVDCPGPDFDAISASPRGAALTRSESLLR